MRAETLAEQLFFTTCHLKAQSKAQEWTGTGFMYKVQTDKGPVDFMVTNKHVLQDAEVLEVLFVGADGKGAPLLGQPARFRVPLDRDNNWFGHRDPEVDVAVVPFSGVLQEMRAHGQQPFVVSVGPEICLGSAVPPIETDALESVTFLGYPQGIFDAANFLPVESRDVV